MTQWINDSIDNPSIFHRNNSVGEAARQFAIVRDQQNSQAIARHHFSQQRQQLASAR
jgi:hypothetical protein